MTKRPFQIPARPEPKPLVWIASSKDDLCALPKDVRRIFGFALRTAQMGGKHLYAKPLKGFSGAGVLEVIANDDGETFRAVYTVRLAGRIYVLDVFQKKSKTGIATPKLDIDRIKARLKLAELDYKDWLEASRKDKRL